MVPMLVIAGIKYGVPAVSALYSYLAHRRAKKNEARIAALEPPQTTSPTAGQK
jgi:hypothetical protein